MYWIKTVSEITGIPKNTLIAWERRYGLIEPKRAEGSGYRVYTDEDIATLRRVQELMAAGYRISEAAAIVNNEGVPTTQGAQQAQPLAEGIEGLRDVLLEALLDYDRRGAERVTKRLVTLPYETLLDELFLPVLQETGHRWEAGEVSTVQEHFVSAWCREQILAMARSLEPGGASAPEAICATPAGEHHEFGLLGVAFRLANRGYRLLYLGADVPTDQLLALVRERRPELVAISIVLERENFDLVSYVKQIAEAAAPEGRVIVGGRAASKHHDLDIDRVQFGGVLPRT
ncbi:MAG: MerR family transcriptional regulator [Deltaproteobacteria bacterium]|nr:MAG: MerR family transcriptional regulator [Deltaproteobacteria bacterium]